MVVRGPITNKAYDISGMTEKHEQDRREYWSEVARDTIPKGSKVVSIEYDKSNDDALILSLKKPDGSIVDIFPMRDDEGNDFGALHCWSNDASSAERVLPVLGDRFRIPR